MSLDLERPRALPPPTAPLASPAVEWARKVDLFGVDVSVTTYDDAVATIVAAARAGQSAIVSCHAVHALVSASDDPALGTMVNAFEMVTPDGQPVRWALNWLHRAGLTDRVYGPELMRRLCHQAALEGVSIYLYGGTEAVLERLRSRLLTWCPTLEIAGYEAPPFRPLTAEEDAAVVTRISTSGAGIVLIGLGCPKQDRFAHAHRARLRAVQVCVGAAFDFHAGVKRTAPAWMQRRGLEWLYRLWQEPRRLWRRYLVTNYRFLAKLAAATLSGRRRRGA